MKVENNFNVMHHSSLCISQDSIVYHRNTAQAKLIINES